MKRGVPLSAERLEDPALKFHAVVPGSLRRRMQRHDAVNWSKVCRDAIERKLEELEAMERVSL